MQESNPISLGLTGSITGTGGGARVSTFIHELTQRGLFIKRHNGNE